jgi:hypothetical protein
VEDSFFSFAECTGGYDVTQTEKHTADPLGPQHSAFDFDMATEKLQGHKSSGIGQFQAELIKAGGRTNRSEIYTLINCIWDKEELPQQWKESMTDLFIRKVTKHVAVMIQAYQFC